MKTIKNIAEWQIYRNSDYFKDQSIGFVPTMGCLHQGHISLIKKSISDNDHTVLSIFVNPSQFNNKDDLKNYPRTIAEDLKISEQCGVSSVILPSAAEMYADNYSFRINEQPSQQELFGEQYYRPGHFDGVLTVVLKFLMLVKPNKIYLGQKDAQQLELIQAMVKSFFIDVDVVACATVREQDGLAMSSRNTRLSIEQRQLASKLPQLLHSHVDDANIQQQLETLGFNVDYVTTRDSRRYAAVTIGDIRLIDNVALTEIKNETVS